MFSLLCYLDSKAPIHDCTPRAFLKSKTYLLGKNERSKPVKISYMLQEQIDYDGRGKRAALTGSLISFTLKSWPINERNYGATEL